MITSDKNGLFGRSGEIRTPITQFWRLLFCRLELLTYYFVVRLLKVSRVDFIAANSRVISSICDSAELLFGQLGFNLHDSRKYILLSKINLLLSKFATVLSVLNFSKLTS